MLLRRLQMAIRRGEKNPLVWESRTKWHPALHQPAAADVEKTVSGLTRPSNREQTHLQFLHNSETLTKRASRGAVYITNMFQPTAGLLWKYFGCEDRSVDEKWGQTWRRKTEPVVHSPVHFVILNFCLLYLIYLETQWIFKTEFLSFFSKHTPCLPLVGQKHNPVPNSAQCRSGSSNKECLDSTTQYKGFKIGWRYYVNIIIIIIIIPYIYIAIFLGTQSALHKKGQSPRSPPLCSIHLDDATAAILHQNAHHTPAYWWGDSDEANQCMGMIRRPWWSEANGRIWPGLHPYSFSKDILGFLMTTESQHLGLTSHPKDGAFLTV